MNPTRTHLCKICNKSRLSNIIPNFSATTKNKKIFMPHFEKGKKGVMSDSRKTLQRKILFNKIKLFILEPRKGSSHQ